MRTTCRWHADDMQSEISGEISLADDICHPDVVHTSSGHLPELPNFMEYYTWCHPHVICTSSTDTHVVCTSSTHHLHRHVICIPSACHPHTSLSCPISCSTMPGVICTSSADTHVICMSSAHHQQTHMLSAHHPHVICIHMSSACHPHVIRTLPWVAQFPAVLCPGVICTSSADTHVICMSSAHHLQIHTSFAQSSWTPLYFLCQRY